MADSSSVPAEDKPKIVVGLLSKQLQAFVDIAPENQTMHEFNCKGPAPDVEFCLYYPGVKLQDFVEAVIVYWDTNSSTILPFDHEQKHLLDSYLNVQKFAAVWVRDTHIYRLFHQAYPNKDRIIKYATQQAIIMAALLFEVADEKGAIDYTMVALNNTVQCLRYSMLRTYVAGFPMQDTSEGRKLWDKIWAMHHVALHFLDVIFLEYREERTRWFALRGDEDSELAARFYHFLHFEDHGNGDGQDIDGTNLEDGEELWVMEEQVDAACAILRASFPPVIQGSEVDGKTTDQALPCTPQRKQKGNGIELSAGTSNDSATMNNPSPVLEPDFVRLLEERSEPDSDTWSIYAEPPSSVPRTPPSSTSAVPLPKTPTKSSRQRKRKFSDREDKGKQPEFCSLD